MNFAFTEEQRLIRETARGFLAEHAGSIRLRAAMASSEGWDRALWRVIGSELGWPGIAVPEAYGGLDLGWVELAILMEETGPRAAAGTVLHQHRPRIAGDPRRRHCGAAGSTAAPHRQRRDDCDAVPGRRSRRDFRGRDARRHRRLRALRQRCGSAHRDAARRQDGRQCRQQRPVLRSSGWSISIRRGRSCRIRFDRVAITEDKILGAAALEQTLALARSCSPPSRTGAAEALSRHDRRLRQDPRAVRPADRLLPGSQASPGDLMVLVESARSAVYYAACTADEDPDGLQEAASVARAYASETFLACAGEAIQLHGGIGFTWDYDAQLYFKRARADATLLGDTAIIANASPG
ncbi:MAG: acyl-CoA dehydrogenase family protein [Aliidongia sp.]